MKYTKTVNFMPTLKDLDKLWAKAVKLRAGLKSEYGGEGYLAAHHITGKPTLSLRYALENGVCITTGQHHFVAHNTGRSKAFREWALRQRGVTEEYLERIKNNRVDKFAMRIYLEKEIERYEN